MYLTGARGPQGLPGLQGLPGELGPMGDLVINVIRSYVLRVINI